MKRFHVNVGVRAFVSAIIVFTFFSTAQTREKGEEKELAPGDVAPTIMLRDIDGKMVHLTDYCGGRCPHTKRKYTVVHYFQTTCKPCLKEIPALKALRGKYAEDRLTILMISIADRREAVVRYKEKHGLDAIFLIDKYGMYARKWGVAKVIDNKVEYNLPYTFLVGPMGKIKAVIPGAHEKMDKLVSSLIEEEK